MAISYSVVPGKIIQRLARTRGGGSALPGLFLEKIDSGFMARTLAQLPRGVVLVSGTNGKTTTTKMIVELLEAQGLRVFTNRTGSNFTRGIVAALIDAVNWRGKLDADIAVLELDEAYAVHFVKAHPPRISILLNVMRDQLDRFGEIDYTAGLLKTVAAATTDHVVINREDPRLLAIGQALAPKKAVYYGLQKTLRQHFPSDDQLHATADLKLPKLPAAAVILDHLEGSSARFRMHGKLTTTSLKLDGVYNVFNAAAALAAVDTVLGSKLQHHALFAKLATIEPAFGRGEIFDINGQPCELVLVKNPSGFQLSLNSFDSADYATMIAINDNYADGRDMSWLWDVSFVDLSLEGVAIVSGLRAYDMALRLRYDDVRVTEITTNLDEAVYLLAHIDQPRRIYCTYTAMLTIRQALARYTNVERVL